jgi:hypothetical protein
MKISLSNTFSLIILNSDTYNLIEKFTAPTGTSSNVSICDFYDCAMRMKVSKAVYSTLLTDYRIINKPRRRQEQLKPCLETPALDSLQDFAENQ